MAWVWKPRGSPEEQRGTPDGTKMFLLSLDLRKVAEDLGSSDPGKGKSLRKIMREIFLPHWAPKRTCLVKTPETASFRNTWRGHLGKMVKQRENLGQWQGSKPHDIPEKEVGAGPTVAEGPQSLRILMVWRNAEIKVELRAMENLGSQCSFWRIGHYKCEVPAQKISRPTYT